MVLRRKSFISVFGKLLIVENLNCPNPFGIKYSPHKIVQMIWSILYGPFESDNDNDNMIQERLHSILTGMITEHNYGDPIPLNRERFEFPDHKLWYLLYFTF